MGNTLDRIKVLAAEGHVLVSDHAYEELIEDGILPTEVIDGVQEAVAIEDYPEAFKGPSVLTLQSDKSGRPVHAVWGIPKSRADEAVLVTAYRPDPTRWSDDFRSRKL